MTQINTDYRTRPGSRHVFLLLVACLMLAVSAIRAQSPGPVAVNTVVVVKNLNNADSVAIADYYERKRNLPAENVCVVRCTDVEECSYKEYEEQLKRPLQQFLAHITRPIDYIVLTKGIPIRTHEGNTGGFSVDSLLVMMDRAEPIGSPGGVATMMSGNPYFNKAERFSHARFGIYLVTRLIGYTRAECLRLVDNSLAATRRVGPFLLHVGPGHNDPGFKSINDSIRQANEILTSRHMTSILSIGDEFAGGYKHLMGYYSWGSNDLKFDKRAYNSLGFAPGGIAETAVSTSARTFADPKASGQSLIADLVAQGATGCKGYVSEPGAAAMAHADILFDRYTAGFNLAESFYMASWHTHWKDMVIGDPICAPYANERAAASASLMTQDGKSVNPAPGKTEVVKDFVKGSIHHRAHGKQVEWERITGKAQVISPIALRLSDGTQVELGSAPKLNENDAKEATDFLRALINAQTVTSFGYVDDTNLQHAMIINGWGLADHSSLHPAEVIARENKRGCWRAEGVVAGTKTEEKPNVLKDRVKGSSYHDKGKREWNRITGRARVIDAHTLEFADGTQILLHVIAPDLDQKGMIDGSLYPCGKEAAEFLRKLIGDQPVMAFLVEAQDDKWIAYAGDTNLGHALVINGWGLAHHSSLHPAEITAREKKRGMWRGEFVDPADWRAGKRLPGEK